jgi:hypothetical protein
MTYCSSISESISDFSAKHKICSSIKHKYDDNENMLDGNPVCDEDGNEKFKYIVGVSYLSGSNNPISGLMNIGSYIHDGNTGVHALVLYRGELIDFAANAQPDEITYGLTRRINPKKKENFSFDHYDWKKYGDYMRGFSDVPFKEVVNFCKQEKWTKYDPTTNNCHIFAIELLRLLGFKKPLPSENIITLDKAIENGKKQLKEWGGEDNIKCIINPKFGISGGKVVTKVFGRIAQGFIVVGTICGAVIGLACLPEIAIAGTIIYIASEVVGAVALIGTSEVEKALVEFIEEGGEKKEE